MKNLLIDTANYDFIKKLWSEIKSEVEPSMIRGITTNPNAFFKLDKNNMSDWLDILPKLCELVSEIRQDDKGEVHIQCPSSLMTESQILKYSELITKYSDGNTKVCLKIPPYLKVLQIVDQINQIVYKTNVTGVSDTATALKCMTYGVNYVSMIPGRMEEVGIDAKKQIAFTQQHGNNKCEIITGSMRTIPGLEWAMQYNTVPTIGEKVWALLLESDNLKTLLSLKDISMDVDDFSPEITEKNFNLSKSFFTQMDNCGEKAFNDFLLMS